MSSERFQPTEKLIDITLKQAKSLAHQFNRHDEALKQLQMDDLKKKAWESGLVGHEVMLKSPFMSGEIQVFDDETGQFERLECAVDPEETHIGTFVDFERWNRGDQSLLMYRIETTFTDGDDPEFLSLWAPVSDSELDLVVMPEEAEQPQPPYVAPSDTDVDEMAYALFEVRKKNAKKQKRYYKQLDAFFERIDTAQEGVSRLTLDRVYELGRLAIDVMAHLDAAKHQEAFAAVAGLLTYVIPPSQPYQIFGDKVAIDTNDQNTRIAAGVINGPITPNGIGIIPDYEKHLDGTLVTSGLYQPAFRYEETPGQIRFVPFIRLEEFTPVLDQSCASSRERYLSYVISQKAVTKP